MALLLSEISEASVLELCEICEDDIDYTYDVVYMITWNPNKYLCGTACSNELKWDSMILKVLQHFRSCMKKYVLQPEFDDTGRLHLHGWFVLYDKIKWLKKVLPTMRRFGFEKITKVKSSDWEYYYKKEIDETVKLLPHYRLPLCHYTDLMILRQIQDKYKEKDNTKNKRLRALTICDYFSWSEVDMLIEE